MAATANDIAAVRLGLEIPEGKAADFTDALLAGFIEAHPVNDAVGRRPTDPGWQPTYDLNAATADLWSLIAASVSALYDFGADRSTFSRSQVYDHARKMQRHFAGKARATSAPITRERQTDILYQGRWPYTADTSLQGYGSVADGYTEDADLQTYEEVEGAMYPPGSTQGEAL
jgi:hypothetical protein